MAGSGVYRPDVPDPEMSCSSSTLLWELADLRVSLILQRHAWSMGYVTCGCKGIVSGTIIRGLKKRGREEEGGEGRRR